MADYENTAPGAKRTRRVSPAVRRAARGLSRDLVTWRKLRGLTQAQLAERAGVSARTISRLEDGDSRLSFENVLAVIRALGMLDELRRAIDPYESDLGRLQAGEKLPQRVRPRRLSAADG